MEIFKKQTSHKLTICEAPLSAAIVGLAFGLNGVFFIWVDSSVTTLTCQRQFQNRGSCEFRQSGLRGSEVRKIRLDFLHGAEVRSSYSGRSRSYKLLLLTEAGEVPFPKTSFQGEKYSIASQINTFISNYNAKFLEVREDSRLVGLFWGLCFWSIGAATLLLSTEILTCSFDQGLSLMTIQQRNFLLINRVLQQPIQKVQSANIESTQHSFINKWGKTVNFSKYYIVLVLNSGERYRLTEYDTQLLQGKQRIVDYISTWLQRSNKLEHNLQHQLNPNAEKLTPQQALDREIATWQELIDVNPDNAEAHYQLGLALYRHDRRKEAATNLQRAKEIFKTQGNSQKADVVQAFLWQLGLE